MKKAIAVVVLFLIIAPSVSAWSLSDLLKSTISNALEIFKREVMPVDGYTGVEVGKSFIIEGANWWNPDYYVRLEDVKVRFSWWIPREVTVKVTVYKVYLGIFAFKYAEYDDIWWTKEKIGDGWIGAFFVWGFDWKRTGWSNATKAYIAYNLPSASDLNIKNVTILENGTVRLLFDDNTTKLMSFEEFEGFGNVTVVDVTYKHIIKSLYIVRKKEKKGEEG
ncbi:hypothetical protein [Thermococcus piezophilus]|uniref:Uncharacterized protein n=1 Tax=Thermococcus piezophilus TaxID=1712654 RepID=A0A172WF53_9EURY|nr:hypothetical protein [Thermococcus piezophilus]ANF22060.1 hypothetical protein A7C91_01790 [Thermococcus piezophilus]